MWQVLIDHFRRYPAQERVVRLLIRHGLRLHDDKIKVGEVEIADTAIARAAHVDRRIVRATVETILKDPEMKRVFGHFSPTLDMKDVAPRLGCGVIEIIPTNASKPGILSGVSRVISDHGISIRQAIVEDPDFTDEPRLYVVTEDRVPGQVLGPLQNVDGVRGVTVY